MSKLNAVIREMVIAALSPVIRPHAWPSGAEPVSYVIQGGLLDGLLASVSDNDDIIEFGLLRRADDEATNVLHVSLDVFDPSEVTLHATSETEERHRLDLVLKDQQGVDRYLAPLIAAFLGQVRPLAA